MVSYFQASIAGYFTITIPPDVPSSFKGSYSNIRYALEGHIGTETRPESGDNNLCGAKLIVSITDTCLLQPIRQESVQNIFCASSSITHLCPRVSFALEKYLLY